MGRYALFPHERPGDNSGISPPDVDKTVRAYMGWAQTLAKQGDLVSGEKLSDEGGRLLRSRDGKLQASDGPDAPTREIIGGPFAIAAKDKAETGKISATCPRLKSGRNARIELRAIDALQPTKSSGHDGPSCRPDRAVRCARLTAGQGVRARTRLER